MDRRALRNRLLLALTAIGLLVALGVLLRPAPIPVDVARVEAGAMAVSIDEQGETRSHDRFVVSAPVAGRLARIELHDGDKVATGQVVASIAPLPLSARELNEINARIAATEAARSEAEQRLRRATNDAQQASREYERVRKLAADGFVSGQAAEQARATSQAATLEAEAARARVEVTVADIRAARAALTGVPVPKAAAAAPLAVRAPGAGRVLRINDPSERVVATGEPLMTIGDLKGLEVVVDVLSTEATRIQPGMPVWIEGWGGTAPLRAVVRLVEPYAATKLSALGIEEKRVKVIADLAEVPPSLGDGYRVKARIVVWQADSVLKIPLSALFRCEQKWCVYVVESGRARRQDVQVGEKNLADAQVLGGLAAGQTVIRYPGNDIAEGARVRVPPAQGR